MRRYKFISLLAQGQKIYRYNFSVLQKCILMQPQIHYDFSNKIGKKKQEKQDKQKEKEKLNLGDTIDLSNIEKKAKDFIAKLKDQMTRLKVGRLNPDMLDELQVPAYGKKNKMSTLAQVSSKAANILQLNIFDESIFNDIMKTLENSNLNLHIKRDGKIITCTQIGGNTKEQRLGVVKEVKTQIQKAKLHLREIRAEGMDYLKPFKKVSSKDVVEQAEKELQESIEGFIDDLDQYSKTKEQEIMNS